MTFHITPQFKIDTDLFHLEFSEGRRQDGAHVRQTIGNATIILPEGFKWESPKMQLWLNKVLKEVMRDHAKAILTRLLRETAEKYGYSYNRLTIKDVRTRWGSCSGLNNINLSLWLLLAPSHLVLYVIKHELAHLRQMNHSPLFWAEVDKMTDGRAKALEKEMKNFALSLYRSGVKN